MTVPQNAVPSKWTPIWSPASNIDMYIQYTHIYIYIHMALHLSFAMARFDPKQWTSRQHCSHLSASKLLDVKCLQHHQKEMPTRSSGVGGLLGSLRKQRVKRPFHFDLTLPILCEHGDGSASLFCHGQIRSKAVNVTTTLQPSFSFKVVGCEVPSAPPKGNAHPNLQIDAQSCSAWWFAVKEFQHGD